MATFLTESVPVSLAGTLGDVGNFRLYKCDQRDVVLFVAKQPILALDKNGKPAVAVTTYTSQATDGSTKITSGAATIGLNTAPQLDQATIDQAKALVASMGVADPNRVRFLSLTTQKGKALLNLPTTSGESDKKHNERDVGTPGGSLSFLANLTEPGALEWSQAIKQGSRVNGDITIQYDYLARVPDVKATVHIHGKRVFEHLSAALKVSYNGFFYGGSAKLEAAWDKLSREGGVEVIYDNFNMLPPETQKLLTDMTQTFAKQGMQILFDQIFAPMPQVAPAEAGNSGGIFGGANFAMKWQKKEDSIDLQQVLVYRGMAWLTQSMDVSLAQLFAGLDASCLTEVPAQQAFDSFVVVDADPMVSNVAVGMTYSEGRAPVNVLFGKDGGQQRSTVVSTNPNAVKVSCNASVNFSAPRWPLIPFKQTATVAEGGGRMSIKTSQWVGRQSIFMFVRDGNKVVPPQDLSADDYLILNVSYAGPHLPNPVRDSAHLNPLTPIDFAYPLDPGGRAGVAKFSAFGVIGGNMVRSPEQVIPQTDTAVFILATRGGGIQLVTSESQLPESDNLAQDLQQFQARNRARGAAKPGEADRPTKEPGANGKGKMLTGRTVGIEYSSEGTSLWLRPLESAGNKRVRLHSAHEAAPFERESRLVKVHLDDAGLYAESIFLELN